MSTKQKKVQGLNITVSMPSTENVEIIIQDNNPKKVSKKTSNKKPILEEKTIPTGSGIVLVKTRTNNGYFVIDPNMMYKDPLKKLGVDRFAKRLKVPKSK